MNGYFEGLEETHKIWMPIFYMQSAILGNFRIKIIQISDPKIKKKNLWDPMNYKAEALGIISSLDAITSTRIWKGGVPVPFWYIKMYNTFLPVNKI